MNTFLNSVKTKPVSSAVRSVAETLAPLDSIAITSPNLIANHKATFEIDGESCVLPRYLFIGPRGGDDPIRVGIFAGLGGDEEEGTYAVVRFLQMLEANPQIAAGYCLFIYPVCNPTGFQDNTHYSRRGKDLLKEFWKDSDEPEIGLLQSEIVSHALHGSIALHAHTGAANFGGAARGAVLTRSLLKPALEAAERFLPVENVIDGVAGKGGLVWNGEDGLLSAPPGMRPSPFEISLHAPKSAPQYLKEYAYVAALNTILVEYRGFISHARNL